LPPLLSPTLPASIEEELAKLPSSPPSLNGKAGHKKTMSLASSSSNTKHLASSRTSSPSLTNSVKSYTKEKSTDVNPKTIDQSFLKTETDAKSDRKVLEAGKRPPTAESKPRSRTPEVGNKSVKINGLAGASSFFEGLKTGNYTSSVVPPTSAPKIEKPELQKKKLVRLKIPKSLRKTVGRILQMKPQPKKIKDIDPRQEKGVEDARRKDREESSDKRVEKDRERVRIDRDRATDRDHKANNKGEDKVHLRGSTKPAMMITHANLLRNARSHRMVSISLKSLEHRYLLLSSLRLFHSKVVRRGHRYQLQSVRARVQPCAESNLATVM